MSVHIGTASPEHADEVVELISAFRDFLGAERPASAGLRAHLPRLLADAATEFRIARDEAGAAVGYTYLHYHDSPWSLGLVAHLEDLFVVESARGDGLGRRLLADALDAARARGAVAMGLHTNERNDAAQRLYRALGFEPVSEERWGHGREVHWARSLDAPGEP